MNGDVLKATRISPYRIDARYGVSMHHLLDNRITMSERGNNLWHPLP
jgi:hypothetical protein